MEKSMHKNKISLAPAHPAIVFSADGYVRLSFQKMQELSLAHLISGLDENDTEPLHGGATFAEISGYTEWISASVPAVSVGWDWRLAAIHTGKRYERYGEPKSNLMLVDSRQQDVGPEMTAALLEAVIDALAWQAEVESYISHRYSFA
jgi:hypothetical protein